MAAVEVERMLKKNKKLKNSPQVGFFFFDQYLPADSFTHSLVHSLIMNERKVKKYREAPPYFQSWRTYLLCG